jgi:hypothetical protein
LILLFQGTIREFLAKIAQLLVVVEKLTFFESAILKIAFQKKKNASSLFKSVIIYGIPMMGQKFDDYLDFQQKARGTLLRPYYTAKRTREIAEHNIHLLSPQKRSQFLHFDIEKVFPRGQP